MWAIIGVSASLLGWVCTSMVRWWASRWGRCRGFNVARWTRDPERVTERRQLAPDCCCVVPTLYEGEFDTQAIRHALERLRAFGSVAAPGFMKPEGIVVFHTAASTMFKVTLEGDEKPKGV